MRQFIYRTFRQFSLLAAALLPLAMPSQATAQSRVEPVLVDAIVAVVNSEVITRREINQRMVEISKQLKAQGIALPDHAELQKQMLERLIVERVQLQTAKENGITADDAVVDRAIQSIATENHLSLPQFRERLAQEGLNYASFREDIRREIIMQRVRERSSTGNTQVSEAEIDNYLSMQKTMGGQSQELHIAHILVRIPENASSQMIAERQQRAEAIAGRLRGGEDFARTAATYSDAPDALNGGDLGWRTPDRLPQLFFEVAANLGEGQVSPVVKSASGFHIIKVVGRRTGQDAGAQGPVIQQTQARHILIKVDQLTTAQEARRKIVDIRDRITHNAATFEELAKQYSEDGSAANGGDLGWIYPGDTVPQFEQAMNALQPGQISGPVESPFGFHLIQVIERKTDAASEERTRQMVRRALRERKVEEATNSWLRELRDTAYVEYREDGFN